MWPTPAGLPGLLTPDAQLNRISEQLADHFTGIFAPETVDRYVFETYTALGRSAKISAHLTNLTGRFAKDRLIALAQAKGAIAKTVPEVLFVCTHNAGRSQIAAALLNEKAAGKVHVRSAGSAPAEEIDPNVRAALDEVGIDLSEAFPKPLTDDVVRAADVVITMGCGDACPIYPGKRYEDWVITDPSGSDLATAREVRDDIDARVEALLDQLGVTGR